MVDEIKTIGDFIGSLRQTENVYANEWIDSFEKFIPSRDWEGLAATAETITAFSCWISAEISKCLRRPNAINNIQVYRKIFNAGHQFLQEIHQKAVEFGLEINPEEIDNILAQDPEKLEKELVH